MLKESRYNYEFQDEGGNFYLCNGLSGTIIGKPAFSLTTESLAASDREFLKTHHFIVESEVDELELLLRRNQSMSDRDDRLELTIMLHENCNFRCTYCFEDFIDRKFSGEVLEDLLRFIDKSLPEGGAVYNHFYGGEPLMAWESLVRINSAIEESAARKKGSYHFFITTNGSLLTLDKADYLARHGVEHVKITLDGPPEIHDRRRFQINGKGTFARILRNLRGALPSLKVILRVNLDGENVASIYRLLDILAEECEPARNLYVDFNIVHDPETGQLSTVVDYADIYRLQKAVLERGFRLNLPSLSRYRYCKFNSKNSYLVDTLGELFLCAKSPETRVGTLKSGATYEGPPAGKRSLPILGGKGVGGNSVDSVAAFYNPKDHCLSCNLLPICGGGCTALTLKAGMPPCPPWKEMYPEYLQIHYRNACAVGAGERG